MKLTIAELLTIDLKKYRHFCKRLTSWTTEELNEKAACYHVMQERENTQCISFKDKLLKCRWMGAYARAIEAELATR